VQRGRWRDTLCDELNIYSGPFLDEHRVIGRRLDCSVGPWPESPFIAAAATVTETRALVNAGPDDRYGAALALLFFQGWRVSEALGLAWEDVDLDKGTARVQRACIYVNHHGSQL
jgi:integrase